MGIFDKLLRVGEGRKVRALADLVPDILALDSELQALDDDRLRAKTGEFRQRLANGEELDNLLIEAFAVMREAATRVIGQRHYEVQLMGGAALHFGWVAEMKTGEGKTLVSTLPVYLNGLSGKGVHIVTVNDYLAANRPARNSIRAWSSCCSTTGNAPNRSAPASRTDQPATARSPCGKRTRKRTPLPDELSQDTVPPSICVTRL